MKTTKAYIDDREVKQALKNIKEIPNKEGRTFLFRLGMLINSSIRTRVQDKGRGTFTKLPKYSAKYARFREKKGRSSAVRNLTFSGRMFNGMTVERFGKERVILSFVDSEKDKALGNDEKTPFYGIGNTEDKVIDDASRMFLQGLNL